MEPILNFLPQASFMRFNKNNTDIQRENSTIPIIALLLFFFLLLFIICITKALIIGQDLIVLDTMEIQNKKTISASKSFQAEYRQETTDADKEMVKWYWSAWAHLHVH